MTEALIFSKNRPMQLELTLHSHEVFWGEKITVLYKATEDQYQHGYDQLQLEYPHVTFLKEDNFKQQVIDYVTRNKYAVFFCDDDVMIRPMHDTSSEFSAFTSHPRVYACVSLRLDKKYTTHFETNARIPAPEFFGNAWNWREARGDWHFPMSVLGHIFRAKDLLPLVETLIYTSPNQFESALADNPLAQPAMLGFNQAKTINLPANLVQTTHRNKAGKVSVTRLNERFLAGERIDLDLVIEQTQDATSCFMLVPFKYMTPSTVPVKDKQLLKALT